MGARVVATANEIAAVTNVVSQVPHKVSFVSSLKTASFSTRPSVRVGASVGVRARVRVGVRAKARVRVRVTETVL